MKRTVLLLVLLLTSAASSQDVNTDGYRILFVSDLHLGVGRDPQNPVDWHATEDFRWHDEFDDFLKEMVRTGGGKLQLVILGDFLELWQSLKQDCEHQRVGRDLGCTESEALARVDRVLSQHHKVIASLGWFAGQGENSLTILAGNHDVALAFPSAREKLLAAFPEPVQARVRIEPSAFWLSPDGRIAAEHGQQIGADPNKFDGWPDRPFIEKGGKTYLAQPWGESFVQEIFNDLEVKFPIIDNLSAELAGIKYASKSATFGQKLAAVGRAIRFLFTQSSLRQTGQFLGEDDVPVWKLDEIQTTLTTDAARWQFLANSLPPTDALRSAMLEAADIPAVPPFTLDEIEAICDRRYYLSETGPGQGIGLCDSTGDLGMVAERLRDAANPKSRNKRFREYFEELRRAHKVTDDLTHYVYGHTHKVEIAYDPYGNAPRKVIVYNDGAWQRTVSPERLCTIAREKGWDDDEVLEKARPEDLPPCYPFVAANRVAGTDKLTIRNWFWVVDKGRGSVSHSCEAAAKIDDSCQ